MEIKNLVLDFPRFGKFNAEIPCSLYSVLYENGMIQDPFRGDNAEQISELSNENCSFLSEFKLVSDDMNSKRLMLEFSNVDTLCTIYLNGKLLGKTDNFHRTYRFDIKPLAKTGVNTLLLCIESPVEFMKRAQERHWLWGEEHPMEEGYLHTTSGIGHIRKPAYMFGWDWGPRLPDMGIYKPIKVISRDLPEIEDVEILQYHKNGTVELEINSVPDETADGAEIRTTLTAPDGTVLYRGNGEHNKISVDSPELWWPNGYGDRPLYTVTVELYVKGDFADKKEKKIGLRTLTVSRDKDEYGREFCFIVNGRKIFAMGACYIPEDSLVPRITAERSEKLIADCADANFNCLRIWGGGMYPFDEFYDICDRYGIILWQDFMFACLNVRMSESFTDTVIAEATEAVKRLRHHACLGLFCGNNEMEYGLMHWDWLEHNDELVKADYLKLYENILPDICDKYAKQVFYWPSSPSSGGGFFEPGSENDGDVHHWDTWIEGKPMEDFRRYYFRFCSEFGFQAFPELKTVAAYTDERDPLSYEMTYHQKRVESDHSMSDYQARRYLYALTFEQYVYCSQVVQGEAIQYAVEHFRRNRGRCMGATYWQLNDCWPGQTWSSLDYYGRRKGLHCFAKRFFARLLLSLHKDGENVTANISSEYAQSFEGKVVLTFKTAGLDVVSRYEVDVCIDGLSAKDVLRVSLKDIKADKRDVFAECKLYDKSGNEAGSSVILLTKPRFYKYADPKLSAEVSGSDGEYVVSVRAENFANHVAITSDKYEITLDDNFFDITDKGICNIRAVSDAPNAEALASALKMISVYNIGRMV